MYIHVRVQEYMYIRVQEYIYMYMYIHVRNTAHLSSVWNLYIGHDIVYLLNTYCTGVVSGTSL